MTTGLLVACLVLPSGSAAAACAPLPVTPDLVDVPVAFVGDVVRTTDGGGAAEVEVLDVWAGPDLPPRVVVVGGQLERGVVSSIDRSFTTGERYAFFPVVDEQGGFRDSACSRTAPLSSLRALDPPGTRAPDPAADAPHDPRQVLSRRTPAAVYAPLWVAGLAVVVGCLALGVSAVRRRVHT